MNPKLKEEIEKLKWKHNETPETKAIAGTYARYNYENLVDEHNESIDKILSIINEIIDDWANEYCDEMQEEVKELKNQLKEKT